VTSREVRPDGAEDLHDDENEQEVVHERDQSEREVALPGHEKVHRVDGHRQRGDEEEDRDDRVDEPIDLIEQAGRPPVERSPLPRHARG